jgi:hypothetical protein
MTALDARNQVCVKHIKKKEVDEADGAMQALVSVCLCSWGCVCVRACVCVCACIKFSENSKVGKGYSWRAICCCMQADLIYMSNLHVPPLSN